VSRQCWSNTCNYWTNRAKKLKRPLPALT